MRRILASILAGLMPFAAVAQAQETRVGGEDLESPSAGIDDAEWLIGQWAGEGIGGADAYESWLAPSGEAASAHPGRRCAPWV